MSSKTHHIYKSRLFVVMLTAGLSAFLSMQAFAAGRILYQEDAQEADRIEVLLAKNATSGSVSITGCEACPLRLNIDAGTRFFFKHKPASPRQVAFLSGKPGTVIYDRKTGRALRILW